MFVNQIQAVPVVYTIGYTAISDKPILMMEPIGFVQIPSWR